jgi:hypothetical protein
MVVRLAQKTLSIKEPQARVAFLMDIFGRDWPQYYDCMLKETCFTHNEGVIRAAMDLASFLSDKTIKNNNEITIALVLKNDAGEEFLRLLDKLCSACDMERCARILL